MWEKTKLSKKSKTVICVLVCLIAAAALILAGRILYLNYFADKTATAVVPDNMIGEAPAGSDASGPGNAAEDSAENNSQVSATVIEIYKGQASDSENFVVYNMLPGDTEIRYFAVQLRHHADVWVYFHAEVTDQTKNLADVLHIRVTHLETDQVIYSGTFADMHADGCGELFAATGSTETVAYYKIEVSLPASAGNEYQAAGLTADFIWTVRDTAPLDPPQTGDDSVIMPWIIILCCFMAVLLLLLVRRGEREVDHAQTE